MPDLGKFPDMKQTQQFARRHMTELLSALALVIAGFSSWMKLFWFGEGLSLLCLVIGAIVGIFFPRMIEKMVNRFYEMTYFEAKTSEIIIGIIKIAVALLVPFIYFLGVGMLAGDAYHYFTRHSQGMKGKDKAA
jgi:hypothetical protein